MRCFQAWDPLSLYGSQHVSPEFRKPCSCGPEHEVLDARRGTIFRAFIVIHLHELLDNSEQEKEPNMHTGLKSESALQALCTLLDLSDLFQSLGELIENQYHSDQISERHMTL